MKYKDIFSDDISRQQNVAELYYQLLETRGRILLSIVLGLNMPTWNLVGDIDMNNSQIAPAIP